MIDIKKIGIKNIITTIFVIGFVFAFLVFTGAIKLGQDAKKVKGKIVLWGTIPYNTMQNYIDMVSSQDLSVSYKVKDPLNYESELINAIASGSGPDLFIMPHEDILRHEDKIFIIPYQSFPKNSYESTYIPEAKLFLNQKGILAIPMAIDPLVMYYNKQLISSSFLVGIPKYWDELNNFVQGITVKKQNGNISISGVALGTYKNVNNAKAIISALLLQNGNTLVGDDSLTGKKKSFITKDDIFSKKAREALRYYISFSQRGSQNYSWNEALPLAQEKFISGELAFYFGKASELEKIRKKNPNLDFDVTFFPQISETSLKKTYGAMTGIAISKQSKNISAAINIASKLSGKDVVKGLTQELFLAPARNDLLREKPEESYHNIFYKSAIISRGWIDPDPEKTNQLFYSLIRSVNSGSLALGKALGQLSIDLDTVLNRTINIHIKNKLTENNTTEIY